MKKIILTALIFGTITASAQISFNDINFKNALLNHLPPIDINDDDEITVTEAAAYDDPLGIDVRQSNITDVTEIKHFTKLVSFTCESNPGLTSIDVTACKELTRLRSHSSGLTSVNVTGLTKLTEIAIHNNKVESIDISTNTALKTFRGTNNNFTSLDFSSCPNLTSVSVNNSISTSPNTLTSLNMKNGNNTAITLFQAGGNSNLSCIEVDDAAWSTTNWTSIDATAEFKTNCGGSASISELTQNIKVYPNPTSSTLNISTEYPTDQLIVTDITGKEMLNINSPATSIDVSTLPRGIYILKAVGSDRTGTSRFIKQ